ncbi:MAG: metal-dependent hydrolase [Chloroflexi bacterium]|nr:metal-dependent hydrolase [Chloroflexota bacterium]
MTAISFTWLGHSTFLFDFDGHKLLVDPFLTGNPAAPTSASELPADLIVVSHGHGDHVTDVVSIANRTGAKVLSNVEVGGWFDKHGLNKGHSVGMNTGGTFDAGFVKVTFVQAFHSSSMPDGSYGGNPQGFVLTAPDGRRLYYSGDTALFGDMALFGEDGLAAAFLCIGDHYTMGVRDSVRATKLLAPKFVVPMHYNTFPTIAQDGDAWAAEIRANTDATPIVLKPGESHTLA